MALTIATSFFDIAFIVSLRQLSIFAQTTDALPEALLELLTAGLSADFLDEKKKILSNLSDINSYFLHSVSGDGDRCDNCDGECVDCDECHAMGKTKHCLGPTGLKGHKSRCHVRHSMLLLTP